MFPTRRRPRGVLEWEFGPGKLIGVPEGPKSAVGDRVGASFTRLPNTLCLLGSEDPRAPRVLGCP